MTPKKSNRPTAKQRAFAEQREAQRLLNNHMVAPRIEELLNRVAAIAEQKFDVTAERILQEIAAVAFYSCCTTASKSRPRSDGRQTGALKLLAHLGLLEGRCRDQEFVHQTGRRSSRREQSSRMPRDAGVGHLLVGAPIEGVLDIVEADRGALAECKGISATLAFRASGAHRLQRLG